MDFTKYKNDVPYPKKKDFTTYSALVKGKLILDNVTEDELDKTVSKHNKLKDSIVYSPNFNEDKWSVVHDAYNKREREMHSQFKTDLFDEEGLGGTNETLNVIFDEAWERGHSCGFEDVAGQFIDLISFIEKYEKAKVR